MSYTFGGATGDDIVLPVVNAVCGPSVSGFFAGWFYPTNISTSGRALLGMGNNLGKITISATSGELDITLPAGTTNGVWTTSGLALTTNAWRFIAVAWSAIAGPTMDVRVWAGDATTPPVAVTVAQATAPVGTFTSATSATLGNGAASASIAFIGDIGHIDLISTNIAGGANHPFGQSAYGAFSSEAEAILLGRYAAPLWLGQARALPMGRVVNNTTSMQHVSLDLTLQPCAYRHVQTTSANESLVSVTVNGATFSAQNPPRPRQGLGMAGYNARVVGRR